MRPSLAYLPSPSQGVWHIGAIPIRAYALCIIAGIVVAIWMGERRWQARGGSPGTVSDVAVRAVIFGLIGGRVYHVLTDPELYFGDGRHPMDVFKVWEGGLGIWGAISFGAVGAWLGCRARNISLRTYADVVAPGVAVAQAIGRFGNWFNQELFGKPTTLPWGLKIDPVRPNTVPGAAAYHPTFLYEAIWDLGLAGVLIWAERRFKLGAGRVIALYIMGYPLGRIWIEALRIDTANHILGLRLNIWTCIVVFAAGLILFLRSTGPRQTVLEPADADALADGDAETEHADAEAADADAGAEGDAVAGAGPDDPGSEQVVVPGAEGDAPDEAVEGGAALEQVVVPGAEGDAPAEVDGGAASEQVVVPGAEGDAPAEVGVSGAASSEQVVVPGAEGDPQAPADAKAAAAEAVTEAVAAVPEADAAPAAPPKARAPRKASPAKTAAAKATATKATTTKASPAKTAAAKRAKAPAKGPAAAEAEQGGSPEPGTTASPGADGTAAGTAESGSAVDAKA